MKFKHKLRYINRPRILRKEWWRYRMDLHKLRGEET